MWQKQESIKRQNKKNNAEHKNNEKNTASKGSCSASEDIFLDLRKHIKTKKRTSKNWVVKLRCRNFRGNRPENRPRNENITSKSKRKRPHSAEGNANCGAKNKASYIVKKC